MLSRTATLPEEVERKVDEIIRGVCLDPAQVIQIEGKGWQEGAPLGLGGGRGRNGVAL